LRVLHVGMGKTATSSLQLHVFPRLAQLGLIDAYNPQPLHSGVDAALNGYFDEAQLPQLAAAQQRMLISNETLLEWDPALWEESANRLLRIFGHEVTILITVREPATYLRSLYQQMLHVAKIRTPEDFFLSADEYFAVRRFIRPGELDAIDVDAFDLGRMVSLYIERFASVILVPFEAIGELQFLTALWDISDETHATLVRDFAAAPRVNMSYSRLAVQLTLGRERLLAAIGLRSLSASDRQLRKALAFTRSQPFSARRSLVPSWATMMKPINRYGPKIAYRLPEGLYLGRHLAANAALYDRLRQTPGGYLRYQDGQAKGLDVRLAVRAAAT